MRTVCHEIETADYCGVVAYRPRSHGYRAGLFWHKRCLWLRDVGSYEEGLAMIERELVAVEAELAARAARRASAPVRPPLPGAEIPDGGADGAGHPYRAELS